VRRWRIFDWSRNKKESDQATGAQPNMGVQREIARILPAVDSSLVKSAVRKDLIPTLEQLDEEASGTRVDIKQVIRNCTVPDHLIASMILSNIFLVPKGRKDESDSWPVYEEELRKLGKIRVECIAREYKERIAQRRGKDKNRKKRMFLRLLDVKRDATNKYFEDYEKILASHIQLIRVEIIPIEDELSETKNLFGNAKQKVMTNYENYLNSLKAYNDLLDKHASHKNLGELKDLVSHTMTLEKLGHVLVSYGIAAYSSIELALSPKFKQFVMDKLSYFSFPVLQIVVGGLVFVLSITAYDKIIVGYLERRRLRTKIGELDAKMEKMKTDQEELGDKIKAFKQERDSKVKALTEKAQKEIGALYKGYKFAMALPKIEHAIDNTLESYMKEVEFYKEGNPNVLDLFAQNVIRETGTDADIEKIKELIVRRIHELDL